MLAGQKMTAKIAEQYEIKIVSIQIRFKSAAARKDKWESLYDSALFFPKALNAKHCLAGLLTYPGF